jgi:hypothetical protein
MFARRGARGLGLVYLVCLLVNCSPFQAFLRGNKNIPFAANSLTSFVSRISFAIVKFCSRSVLDFLRPNWDGKKVPATVLRKTQEK